MPTITEQIQNTAIELLENAPQGLRTSELKKAIMAKLPDAHPKTVNGTVWKLPTTLLPKQVYKPQRGLFQHVIFQEKTTPNKKDSES